MAAYPEVREESIELEGEKFAVYFMELENAVVGFFYDRGVLRLGTLAFALPSGFQPAALGTSTVLVGHRNAGVSRILAEYMATAKGKIALASVALSKEDLKSGRVLLNLLKKVL